MSMRSNTIVSHARHEVCRYRAPLFLFCVLQVSAAVTPNAMLFPKYFDFARVAGAANTAQRDVQNSDG